MKNLEHWYLVFELECSEDEHVIPYSGPLPMSVLRMQGVMLTFMYGALQSFSCTYLIQIPPIAKYHHRLEKQI